MKTLNCPECRKDLRLAAFNISGDCYAECEECGFYLEREVLRKGGENQKSHDRRCYVELRNSIIKKYAERSTSNYLSHQIKEHQIVRPYPWIDIKPTDAFLRENGEVFINSYIASEDNILTDEPLKARKIVFVERMNDKSRYFSIVEIAKRRNSETLIYLTDVQSRQTWTIIP